MTRINAKDLAAKVKEMRDTQKEFFKTKQFPALDKARRLEREVDGMIDTVLAYGQPVTGNLFEANGNGN